MFRRFRRPPGTPERGSRSTARSAEQDRLRAVVIACILADPLSELADPSVRGRLELGSEDVTFDELGLDSLARLTLATRLDGDHGYAVSESDVAAAGSVVRLTDLLASLPSPHREEDGGSPVA